jgi:hypothetical protein
MTTTQLTGTRCRTNRAVQDKTGRIEASTEGRIRCVSENLGRLLVMVDWDRGGSSVLFPDELEILGTA